MGEIVEPSKSSFDINSLLFSSAWKFMLNLWQVLWRKRRSIHSTGTGKSLLEKSRTDKRVCSTSSIQKPWMNQQAMGHLVRLESIVNTTRTTGRSGEVASLLTMLQLNPPQTSFVQPSRYLGISPLKSEEGRCERIEFSFLFTQWRDSHWGGKK